MLEQVSLTGTQAVAGLMGLGAALYVLVEVIKRLLPPHVTHTRYWTRLVPVLAPLLGVVVAPLIAADWRVEGVPLSHLANALAGLVAGWMGGGLYSTLAQTLMGKDHRLSPPASQD